jgi:uncharacterized YigZ family protein
MLFDDTYKTIDVPAEGMFRDRGSKFLAFAFPVSTAEEIAEILNKLKKEHSAANHHCYAWRLGVAGDSYRANDDGEPSGTAGKPIYNQILSAGITNVLLVVVRYFGGTLLGVSGLINAYKSAAADCIANSKIVEKHITEIYRLEFSYDAMNAVMKILKDYDLAQSKQKFELECELEFAVRKSEADGVVSALKSISSVKATWLRTN